MWKPPQSPVLRHLLHVLRSSSPSHFLYNSPPSHFLYNSPPSHFLSPLRSLATTSSAPQNPSDLARKISVELTKFASSSDPPSHNLPRHFSLNFSDVCFTTPFVLEILNISPSAGRASIEFFRWLVRNRSFTADDTSLSHLVNYLGRRKDFKAVDDVLVEFRLSAGRESLSAAIDRLIRAGRASQAVHFFDRMESDYGLKPDLQQLSFLVSSLCSHGFTGHAERLAKRIAEKIFPNLQICYDLIRGYSNEGKLDDAKRMMREIIRGGFVLGTPAYNSIIDCVCRLCRKKDPFRLLPEAQKLLSEMESSGIPLDHETFHVLIYNLCKIRKTGDAMKLFKEMGQWCCSPGPETYLVLIRSLYQAARLSEAEETIEFMRSAGFDKSLDRKAYYGFIKILCGIERVEHAMKVFRKMKGCGHAPGIKTYGLLIQKLATHNQRDRAEALFKEAITNGVPVVPQIYKVDPRYEKVKKKKKEKKRETLPEKMKRKRKTLKRLRFSFVKKPRSSRRFV